MLTSTGTNGFVVWWFDIWEYPKAQPVVVLIKIVQETEPWLKVSSDRLGEPVIELFKLMDMEILTILSECLILGNIYIIFMKSNVHLFDCLL